jgi:hypothetical protein
MKLWRRPIEGQESYVYFWHKADILVALNNVRFLGAKRTS